MKALVKVSQNKDDQRCGQVFVSYGFYFTTLEAVKHKTAQNDFDAARFDPLKEMSVRSKFIPATNNH